MGGEDLVEHVQSPHLLDLERQIHKIGDSHLVQPLLATEYLQETA